MKSEENNDVFRLCFTQHTPQTALFRLLHSGFIFIILLWPKYLSSSQNRWEWFKKIHSPIPLPQSQPTEIKIFYSLQIHTLKLIPRVFKYLLSTVLNLSLKQSCERTLTALADCRALLQCLRKRWKRTCWFQTSLRLQDGMAGDMVGFYSSWPPESPRLPFLTASFYHVISGSTA